MFKYFRELHDIYIIYQINIYVYYYYYYYWKYAVEEI